MQGTAAIINPCKQSYYIQEVRGEIRRIYRPPVSASVCTKLHTLAADKSFSAQRGCAETDRFCIGCRSSAFCMILLLPDAGRRMKILLFACSSLVTLGMAFRIRTLQHFCKAVILYHGAAFLLAGALNALYGAFGRAPFMDTIQASACAAAIGVTVLCVLRWEKIKREEIVITVILEEGSVQVTLKALIDSGNSLYDPISGKPVCVVEREALEGKIPLDIPEKFRLIPYHSIGKSMA